MACVPTLTCRDIFNFEEQSGTETYGSKDELVLWNRAAVDVHGFASGGDYAEPEDKHMYLTYNAARAAGMASSDPGYNHDNDPEWNLTDMRWKGKGGMDFHTDNNTRQGLLEANKWPSQTGREERTITAWVKVNVASITGGFSTEDVIAGWGNNSGSEGFAVAVRDNKAVAYISPGAITNGPDLNDSQWHHVAAVLRKPFSGSGGTIPQLQDVSLYVDGEEFTSTSTTAIDTGKRPFMIGIHPAVLGASRYWRGYIDELAIWKSPVDSAKITEQFKVGKPRNKR